MNIYLDIDGVLLANENAATEYANEFLLTLLAKYPDTTYWLTTHCWHGDNRAKEVLTPFLNPLTIELLHKVKPTEWGESKTDAIDFSQPFLWFDDDLMAAEESVLLANGVFDSLIKVDLQKDPEQLRRFITSFPIPSDAV